jgi:hypothetical protein
MFRVLAFLSKRSDIDLDEFIDYVTVELAFSDRSAFDAWMAQLSGLGAGDLVGADEAKFLDRSRTRAYVVKEHVTTG